MENNKIKRKKKSKITQNINHMFDVYVPIYNVNVKFCIGEYDFCLNKIDEITSNKNEKSTLYECFNRKSFLGVTFNLEETYFVFVKEHTDSNTVAHEIFHAVFALLNDKGIKASSDSEEVYAYLIGHITEEFYKNVREFIFNK